MSQNNTSEILIKLGIKDEQQGCSNGTEWFGSDSKILLFGCEGLTDATMYKKLLSDGLEKI